MRSSFLVSIATGVTLAGMCVAPAFGQREPDPPKIVRPAKAYVPPRTADGQPDLEGTWQPQSGQAIYSVLPHPAGFFLGSESKTGIVDGGTLPYQPWAAAEVAHLTEHMEFDPTGHCHYEGIPHVNMFAFRLLETPKFIAVLHENMHARRLIYMDGKPHPQGYKAWMGDSRGHWEGNTLVVDVADNNDKAVFDMAGHFHSDAMHVVERFTPIDKDTIEYVATFEDPKAFTRPFTMRFPLKRVPNAPEPFESDCFGGERDQEHIVTGLATLKEHYYSK